MHLSSRIVRSMRLVLILTTLAAVTGLCVLALRPQIARSMPWWLGWFGRAGSWPTVVLVLLLLAGLCAFAFRSSSLRRGVVPIGVIAVFAAASAVLGFCSYWSCHDASHPLFITPLTWTAALVKGSVSDLQLKGGRICPDPAPTALDVARLSALSAILTAFGGVVVSVFKTQLDRILVSFASRVTVIIGVDDDTLPLVSAIAHASNRRSTLVVITDVVDEANDQEARMLGARVLTADLDAPQQSLEMLSLWTRLERLYLVSADPTTNLFWLDVISRRMAEVDRRQRLPLIVRIDDPWQAEAWRAKQFGGSDTRWAADAIGKYEVTARYLMDHITADRSVRAVFVCGTSMLTSALCANVTSRKLEHDYYADPGATAPPALILVGEEAEQYQRDHEGRLELIGITATPPFVEAAPVAPTTQTLTRLIAEKGEHACAVIFVDDPSGRESESAITGTRLASKHPTLAVYTWDPDARRAANAYHILGRLRTYHLSLDVAGGQAQDAWERAAKLIHERYVASAQTTSSPSLSQLPWAELSEFYRGSNRRLVRNALWMVESIANHTWNTWNHPPTPSADRDLAGLPPLEQLARLGFDHQTAIEMAHTEHEDWCRYYRRGGWKHGATRDDAKKLHEKLVDWSTIESNPQLLDAALTSLSATLLSLRQLGYRSCPVWHPFARTGVVIAEQRHEPWTWISRSGETMHADAGDWSVEQNGERWSVRNSIFQSTYTHVEGRQWQRTGVIMARPARPGEKLETLEGVVTAGPDDWVVRGPGSEVWPVPSDVFAQRYARCESDPDPLLGAEQV